MTYDLEMETRRAEFELEHAAEQARLRREFRRAIYGTDTVPPVTIVPRALTFAERAAAFENAVRPTSRAARRKRSAAAMLAARIANRMGRTV